MTKAPARFSVPTLGRAVAFWTLTLCGVVGCSSVGVKGEAAEPIPSEEEEEMSPDVSLGPEDDDDSEPEDPDSISTGGAGGAAGAPSADQCLQFMSWGAVAARGAVPGASGMDAIVDWLNDASSAKGEHFAAKPEITAEFLAAYDVVLLQNLSAWVISDEEVLILQDWVRAGGGVMSLSGYEGDPEQVVATNRLLSFSGLNYVSRSEFGDTSTTLGECGYCLDSTSRQEGWNEEHPIAQGITAVGAFGGRSIQGDGVLVSQEEGKVLGMTKEIDAGRVFLFHDDWISYHAAWSHSAPGECTQNAECANVSPRDTYQVARLWKNAFDWLASGQECFVVDDLELFDSHRQ